MESLYYFIFKIQNLNISLIKRTPLCVTRSLLHTFQEARVTSLTSPPFSLFKTIVAKNALSEMLGIANYLLYFEIHYNMMICCLKKKELKREGSAKTKEKKTNRHTNSSPRQVDR